MAVVELSPGAVAQSAALHAGAVGKLAPIVHGDCLEYQRELVAPLALQIVESLHHAGRAFVWELGRDFFAGEPFGEHQNGSPQYTAKRSAESISTGTATTQKKPGTAQTSAK